MNYEDTQLTDAELVDWQGREYRAEAKCDICLEPLDECACDAEAA